MTSFVPSFHVNKANTYLMIKKLVDQIFVWVWPVFCFCVPLFANDLDNLINCLESVPSAETSVYQLRDNQGRSMDCLKVWSMNHGEYMAIYHSFKEGVFSVRLARSKNLLDWQFLVCLDEHASQPNIWQSANGPFIAAYEKDAPNSCWIKLRFYPDYAHLIQAKFSAEYDIQRTLAPTAEGTPSFESVRLIDNQIDQSEIHLRFHYYKRAEVDRLAEGRLTNFRQWEAKPLDQINRQIKKQGSSGNFGDRDKFNWKEKFYYLQEVQKTAGDWTSWQVFLCDSGGMPSRKLSIQSHHGSVSYSNPNISWVRNVEGENKLVVTLFLPSEGNAPKESGQLLYVLDPTKFSKATP